MESTRVPRPSKEKKTFNVWPHIDISYCVCCYHFDIYIIIIVLIAVVIVVYPVYSLVSVFCAVCNYLRPFSWLKQPKREEIWLFCNYWKKNQVFLLQTRTCFSLFCNLRSSNQIIDPSYEPGNCMWFFSFNMPRSREQFRSKSANIRVRQIPPPAVKATSLHGRAFGLFVDQQRPLIRKNVGFKNAYFLPFFWLEWVFWNAFLLFITIENWCFVRRHLTRTKSSMG